MISTCLFFNSLSIKDQFFEKHAVQKNVRTFFKSFLLLFSTNESIGFHAVLEKLSPFVDRLIEELFVTETLDDDNFYIITVLIIFLTSSVFPEQQLAPILARMREKNFLVLLKKKLSNLLRNSAFFPELFDCIINVGSPFLEMLFPVLLHSVVEILHDERHSLTPFFLECDLLTEHCFLKTTPPFSLHLQAKSNMFTGIFKRMFSLIACMPIEGACLDTFFQLVAKAIKKLCFESNSVTTFQFKSILSQLGLANQPMSYSSLAEFTKQLNVFYSSFSNSYLFLYSLHAVLQESLTQAAAFEDSLLSFDDPSTHWSLPSLKFGHQQIGTLLLLEPYHLFGHFCPTMFSSSIGALEPWLADFSTTLFNGIKMSSVGSLNEHNPVLQNINSMDVINQLKLQLKNSTAAADQLSMELEKRTIAFHSLERHLIEHQEMISKLSAQNEASTNLLEENSISISDLKSELRQKEQIIESSDVELAGLEEKIVSLKSLNTTLLEELERTASEKETLINHFEMEKNDILDQFSCKLNEKETSISKLHDEIEKNICENRALLSKCNHLETIVEQKSSNENSLSAEINLLSSECNRLKMRLTQFESELLSKEEVIIELRTLNKDFHVEVSIKLMLFIE